MDDPLEAQVGRLLKARGLTVALAESCTGGLVAHRLTNVPGSSAYLLGGVVSYSNEAKQHVLGVSPDTLRVHGAVSAETALEMARGARRLFGADLAVSVTGVAGPDGGSAAKPVGLTFIALAAEGNEIVEQQLWQKDRLGNKDESADAALRLIGRFLSVEAEVQPDGSVRPLWFVWQGERKRVTDVGRQWVEGEPGKRRRHVLVMTDAQHSPGGGETFELTLSLDSWTWAVAAISSRPVAV